MFPCVFSVCNLTILTILERNILVSFNKNLRVPNVEILCLIHSLIFPRISIEQGTNLVFVELDLFKVGFLFSLQFHAVTFTVFFVVCLH